MCVGVQHMDRASRNQKFLLGIDIQNFSHEEKRLIIDFSSPKSAGRPVTNDSRFHEILGFWERSHNYHEPRQVAIPDSERFRGTLQYAVESHGKAIT
jgi:hypothetical protein